MNADRSGAQILVDCLLGQGVKHAFLVPGESYLAVLDALVDAPEIALTVCRQEGGAAMMAEAHGKLTGKPGICMVTRGPGATNASAGLHVAFQDSTPMILFVGQVARGMREREAFQEIDYRRMFGQVAKWVAEIDTPDRIAEFVSRAFHVACSGRPGPVVLALPEDMLVERSAPAPKLPPVKTPHADVPPDSWRELEKLLTVAERPLVVVGGGPWNRDAKAALEEFSSNWNIPVAASFRCQDFFDNEHPNYAGDVGIGINPKLAERLRTSDLLVLLGTRFGEMESSGYSLIEIPRPKQKLVHVFPDSSELGRVYFPTLAIHASPVHLALRLATLAPPAEQGARCEETASARADYKDWSSLPDGIGNLRMPDVMRVVSTTMPDDTIVTNGAGNYTVWVHRFHRYREFRTQLAPISGSMGYGLPAAVAAARTHPDRPVVCFAGDGCFLMHGQELATARQYDLKIIVLIVNNGMYGTIRMHQERHYPGRVSATDLINPDFASLATAYGCHGEAVEHSDEFEAALDRAIAADGPAVIELRIDAEALTPSKTLSEIRAEAEARLGCTPALAG
ncbi:thiamine pyrophosphate-binding protein [Hoeflea sp.]|uniref:thiamine pyrophosphate-binding protein n=1 Tax=Hoeflea sp. TaxID=1940281 RepID=UPI003B02A95C